MFPLPIVNQAANREHARQPGVVIPVSKGAKPTKKFASEGILRFGGACIRQDSKLGASSRHWRSVARDYWRSLHKRGELRLPLSTAASCLPAPERLFTAAPRTMSTSGVSPMLASDSVMAVTGV